MQTCYHKKMKDVSDYTVIYDISSDRERNKIDELLKGFGFRVQKSVFECTLKKRGREELIAQLEKLDIQTGFVKIYRLEYSWKDCTIGAKKKKDIDDGYAYIV